MKTLQTASLAVLATAGYASASLDASAPASINVAYASSTAVSDRAITDLSLATAGATPTSWSLYDSYCPTGGYSNPSAADAHIHVLNGQHGKMYLTFPQCTFAPDVATTGHTTEIVAWVDLCGDAESDNTKPRYMVQPGAAGTGFETVQITRESEITFAKTDGRVVVGPIPESVWGDAGGCDAQSAGTLTPRFHQCHKVSATATQAHFTTQTTTQILAEAAAADGFGTSWECQYTDISMTLVNGLPSIGSVSSSLSTQETSDSDLTHDGSTTLNKITFRASDIGQYTCAATGLETKTNSQMAFVNGAADTNVLAASGVGCRVVTPLAINAPFLHNIWIDATANSALVNFLTSSTESYTLEVEHAECVGATDAAGSSVAVTNTDLGHTHFVTNADIAHTSVAAGSPTLAKNEFIIPGVFHDDDIQSMCGLSATQYASVDIALYVKFTISNPSNNNVPGARRLRVQMPFKAERRLESTAAEGALTPAVKFSSPEISIIAIKNGNFSDNVTTYANPEYVSKHDVTNHYDDTISKVDTAVIIIFSFIALVFAGCSVAYCRVNSKKILSKHYPVQGDTEERKSLVIKNIHG